MKEVYSKGKIIIPYHKLEKEEYELCQYYIKLSKSEGNFIGAVKSVTQISPVVLINKTLRVIRCTKSFSEEEQSSLEQMVKYYEILRKEAKDYEFGTSQQFFWLIRDFRLNTLTDYLSETTIKEAEANYLMLKILELIKSNHQSNIPHGHLTPNNFIIDQDNLSLVDHLISFSSFNDYDLEYMAPEAKRGDLPSMASDLYAFGKIIKFIYQGISCPLPMDLPDRLCDSDPRKRPLIFEVDTLVNGIFEEKRRPTKHWHNVDSFGDENDPNYDGYLTPELIQKIREEYSHESKLKIESEETNEEEFEATEEIKEVNQIKDLVKVKDSAEDLSEDLEESESYQKPSSRKNLLFQLVFLLLILFLIYYQFFRASGVNEPIPPKVSKYERVLTLLGNSEVKISKDGKEILNQLNKGNYQRGDILTFISPDELEKNQKIKLNSLLSLLSDQPDLLVKIYQDSENFGLFKKDFLWLSNPIINWDEVNPISKLLIFTNRVPSQGLGIKHLFDLLFHPDQEIQAQATKRLINKVALDRQAEFYMELLNSIDKFSREELAFLLEALEKEGSLKLALITTWFENTKPDKETVFNLVLKRKAPLSTSEEEKDYFSFEAARYLKDYLTKLDKSKTQQLKNHHEKQLEIYSK